ncbi:hypothetical protein EJB05_44891, partial [Eragrostis curvula]
INGVNLVVNGGRIGTKRGLGAGRSRGRVRSRVIHTVHVERTRSTDGSRDEVTRVDIDMVSRFGPQNRRRTVSRFGLQNRRRRMVVHVAPSRR